MGVFQKMMDYGSANLKYYGAHPLFAKECKMNLSVNTEEFKFGTMTKKYSYSIEDVKHVSIQTEKEVMERFTATRIALLGPFALAFKKKKITKSKYLVIECKDAILTFEGDCLQARNFATKLYNNINKIK